MRWNRELCTAEAQLYRTKRDFRKASRNAYEYAYRYGFLDQICTHMVTIGSKYKRCVYAYEFPNNHVYVGITSDFLRRKSDRESKSRDTVTRYITKTGLQPVHKQLTDYLQVEVAQELEGQYVREYRDLGWQILNKVKTGGIGGDILLWTHDLCIAEGLKYNTRNEFNHQSKGAFDACRRNGWLPEVYSHMITVRKPSGYWTFETCLREAQRYNSLREFREGSGGAYYKARVNLWLGECCKHM
jgi:hypothetical protein